MCLHVLHYRLPSSSNTASAASGADKAALAARMEAFRKDAQKMATNVHQTSMFARGLSDKVRSLDTAQVRVRICADADAVA